jgi:hypothetical protein
MSKNNTSLGENALLKNKNGTDNTAVGAGSLFENDIGDQNTSVGSSALGVSMGNGNTSVGAAALYNVDGDYNTSIGHDSGTNITGTGNKTSGSFNTFLGADTKINSSQNLVNSTAIGYGARITGSNQIVLGGNELGVYPDVIVTGTAHFLNEPSSYNSTSIVSKKYVDDSINKISGGVTTGTGTSTGSGATGPQGPTGPAGTSTGPGATGPQGPQGPTGPAGTSTGSGGPGATGPQGNTGAKGDTGPKGDTGASATIKPSDSITVANIDVTGTASTLNLTTTSDATINGIKVGKGPGTATPNNNTAIGQNALLANTQGNFNTAIGNVALRNNTQGRLNTSIGSEASFTNESGVANTAIGNSALYYNKSGSENTAIGFLAGSNFNGGTTANYNTFLGAYTDFDIPSNNYFYSTAVGYAAQITKSNEIVLGRSSETVRIPGNMTVSGNLTATTYTSSDYRIKENVKTLDDNYVVDMLNPVTYINTKTNKQDIGLIAHEVQEVFPELVKGMKDDEELQSVNYVGLIPILIKEIQDLKEKYRILEEKVLN